MLEDPLELDKKEAEKMIDKAARWVVRQGFEVPVAVLLEVVRPLTFMGSQYLSTLVAFLYPIFGRERVDKLVAFLSERENIARLAERIEKYSEEGLPEEESGCTQHTRC